MTEDNITYIKAVEDDINDLAALRCEFLDELNKLDETSLNKLRISSTDYFKKAFHDKTFIAWLAKNNNEIVATSGICFYNVPPNKSCPNGKVGYIQNMYTKKEYRNKGIAKSLFSKIVDEAKANGCTKILLNATDMGRPIYEKFGFKDTKGDMQLHI